MAKQAQKNPATVAAKWATNLGNATATMTAGVQAVQTSPTALAAQHPDSYLAGVQQAVSSGKWARNLQAVSLQSWQQDMIQKGIPRVSQGANASKGKVQSFQSQLLPFVYNLRSQLPPRGGLGQNVARMTAFVQGMANFSYNKGG
jgi:hypothetical protein